MAKTLARRFPFRDLYEMIVARYKVTNTPFTQYDCDAVLGVSKGYTSNHLDKLLTIWRADRMACKVGFHPSEVWPDYWNTNEDYPTEMV